MIKALYYFSIIWTLASIADLVETLFLDNYVATLQPSEISNLLLLVVTALSIPLSFKIAPNKKLQKTLLILSVGMFLHYLLLWIFPLSRPGRAIANFISVVIGIITFLSVRKEKSFSRNRAIQQS